MPLRPPSLWGSRQPGIGYRHNWAHPLARGLVAHYLCNEGAGTRIYDVARKNHGTLTGSIAWTKARGGRSLAPASSGYALLPAADVFAFGKSAFTVCGWFALSDVSTFSILLSLGGSNTVGGVISAGPPNGLAYYANAQRTTGSTAQAVNRDYFFAIVGDGGPDGARAIRLYLNGAQEGATYTTNYNFAKIDWALGGNQSSFSEFLRGSIRDVRIYNRAMSVAEMRQLVASPYADVEPPRGRYRYSRERTQLTAGVASVGSVSLGVALAAGAVAGASGATLLSEAASAQAPALAALSGVGSAAGMQAARADSAPVARVDSTGQLGAGADAPVDIAAAPRAAVELTDAAMAEALGAGALTATAETMHTAQCNTAALAAGLAIALETARAESPAAAAWALSASGWGLASGVGVAQVAHALSVIAGARITPTAPATPMFTALAEARIVSRCIVTIFSFPAHLNSAVTRRVRLEADASPVTALKSGARRTTQLSIGAIHVAC